MPIHELEYVFEPVVFTKNGHILAYEQLAREPGGTCATFIQDLSEEGRFLFDKKTLEVAAEAVKFMSGKSIFVNVFPENSRFAAEFIRKNGLQKKIGLELNEGFGFSDIVTIQSEYKDVWFLLDDVTSRGTFMDTIMREELRRLAFTIKIPFPHKKQACHGEFDINVFPSNWTIIVEGVSPNEVELLSNEGYLFAQGRELEGQIRIYSREVKGLLKA